MPSAQSATELLASLQQLRVALELTARARVQQLRLTLERAELHERARRAAEQIRAVPWEDAVDRVRNYPLREHAADIIERVRPMSQRALAACTVASASIAALASFAAILALTAGSLILRPRATFCELLGLDVTETDDGDALAELCAHYTSTRAVLALVLYRAAVDPGDTARRRGLQLGALLLGGSVATRAACSVRDGLPHSVFSRIMAFLETLGAAAFVALWIASGREGRAPAQPQPPPSSARGRPSTSPARHRAAGYIVVDGQRFDRSIVELARELQAAKKGGGMLGKAEAAKLLADARDGPGVTETERETLRWVCASFGMTRAARSYLLEQCSVPAGWVVK